MIFEPVGRFFYVLQIVFVQMPNLQIVNQKGIIANLN